MRSHGHTALGDVSDLPVPNNIGHGILSLALSMNTGSTEATLCLFGSYHLNPPLCAPECIRQWLSHMIIYALSIHHDYPPEFNKTSGRNLLHGMSSQYL
jgi:hypothetical protein